MNQIAPFVAERQQPYAPIVRLTLRRGDYVLLVDGGDGALRYSLLNPGLPLSATCALVTSVDRDSIRARMHGKGAKIYERRDVVAVRSSIPEIRTLFDKLCAIGDAARNDIRTHRQRVEADALLLVDEALSGQQVA